MKANCPRPHEPVALITHLTRWLITLRCLFRRSIQVNYFPSVPRINYVDILTSFIRSQVRIFFSFFNKPRIFLSLTPWKIIITHTHTYVIWILPIMQFWMTGSPSAQYTGFIRNTLHNPLDLFSLIFLLYLSLSINFSPCITPLSLSSTRDLFNHDFVFPFGNHLL